MRERPERWRVRKAAIVLASMSIAFVCPLRAEADRCPEDAIGCHVENVFWEWEDVLFDGFDFDTGWLPESSPLQVRLTAEARGASEVAIDGQSHTHWPRALTESLSDPLEGDGGWLSLDYGLEIHAFFRFDVTVADQRFTFSQEIPLPLPVHDLRAHDETTFAAFDLPYGDAPWAEARDATRRLTLAGLDLASWVGIPGVSGGLALEGEAFVESAYLSDAVEVEGSREIASSRTTTLVPSRSAAGFGEERRIVLAPRGRLRGAVGIAIFPTISLEVLGRGFSFDLFEVPLELPLPERTIAFAPFEVWVPLPDVALPEDTVDFGVLEIGEEGSARASIENRGRAPLVLSSLSVDGPFEVAAGPITVPAGGELALMIKAVAAPVAFDEGLLVLETNDPDRPRVEIALVYETATAAPDGGPPPAPMDAGVPPAAATDAGPAYLAPGASGCTCAAVAGQDDHGDDPAQAPALLIVALGTTLLGRRRLRRRRCYTETQ